MSAFASSLRRTAERALKALQTAADTRVVSPARSFPYDHPLDWDPAPGRRRASLLEQAIRAATEPDLTRRAWHLVALAAKLKREGLSDYALVILDSAVALGPRPEAIRAAYTCAVAIHTGKGDFDLALKVAEQQGVIDVDDELLVSLERTYGELWDETGLAEFELLRSRCAEVRRARQVTAA